MIVQKAVKPSETMTVHRMHVRPCARRHLLSSCRPAFKGFTLIELIIVMVLTGIVAAVVAVFIPKPVQAYVDSVARADLTDVADTALRRMARDIRLALPNSMRVGGSNSQFLELLLTKTGGRYLAEDDGTGFGNPLKFDSGDCSVTASDCTFDVLGIMPSGVQTIVAGDNVVVYNLGPGLDPADAYNCGSGVCNRAVINSVTGNRITMASNPFVNQAADKKMKSPSKRFQIVSTPVTYLCDAAAAGGTGELRRYWSYPIQTGQPTDTSSAPLSAAAVAILATGVQSCSFSYQGLTNLHSGLMTLTITLQNSSASVTLMHQVHVDNTP